MPGVRVTPGALRFERWRDAVRKKEDDAQARLMAERRSDDVPISHYRLAHEIAAVVDAGTTVVGDGGDVVGCASKIVALSRPGQWLDPGPFGCLGVGPSFAIAAKLLRPDQRVLLIAGDGAFGLNGMEIETAVRFYEKLATDDKVDLMLVSSTPETASGSVARDCSRSIDSERCGAGAKVATDSRWAARALMPTARGRLAVVALPAGLGAATPRLLAIGGETETGVTGV